MNQKITKNQLKQPSKNSTQKSILIYFILFILLIYFSIILLCQNYRAKKSQSEFQATSVLSLFDIDCTENVFLPFPQIPPLEGIKISSQISGQPSLTAKSIFTMERLINQSKSLVSFEVFMLKYRFLTVKKSLEEFQAGKIDRIKLSLNEDNLAFARGLVLGEKTPEAGYIPDFENAGMMHVLVASGFNVALVAGVAWMIVKKLPRMTQVYLVLLILWGYAAYLDFQPPILRATWMFSLVTLLKQAAVRTKKNHILAWSVVCIVAVQPELLNSLSLWLSALATLGILVFSRRLSLFWPQEHGTNRGGIGRILLEEATTSVSAQALIFPLLVWFFESVNLVSFAANPVMLPWLGTLTQAAALEVALAFLDRFWLGRILAWLLGRALSGVFELYFAAVAWWQRLAFLNFTPNRAQTTAVLWWWAALTGGVWLLTRIKHRRKAHFLHEKT